MYSPRFRSKWQISTPSVLRMLAGSALNLTPSPLSHMSPTDQSGRVTSAIWKFAVTAWSPAFRVRRHQVEQSLTLVVDLAAVCYHGRGTELAQSRRHYLVPWDVPYAGNADTCPVNR